MSVASFSLVNISNRPNVMDDLPMPGAFLWFLATYEYLKYLAF